ncbi:unnamed protein product [Rhizophagus irregularis]|nr:unnamed protein product [Rhizophagus irregularis]
MLLKRLHNKKTEDPQWIISMKFDSITSSLTHLFWMSPKQQILWLRYHDVIMHDNTYKTNRYNRPLSLFVTPDNNLKTRIVAQAIVDDETQLSYEWVFQCVKEAIGVSPKVFVTDGNSAVNATVIIQFLNTFHMHCIWHISQNLLKQLKGKLSSSFDDFMKDFYKARNSLREEQFNERWDALLQNYPQSKDYLMKVLGCNPQSWACTFTNRYFTAGIQTTSRNEGENSTLKRLFRDSNLSLSELFDALKERYQEENDYCEFVNWKQTVPQIGFQNVAKSIFSPVVKQLNEFTMPNVIKKQEEQMNLSLCYHATEIDIENARSKEKVLDESDKCIDNLFDYPQVYLSSFLENTSVILEIWEILHLANPQTSHFIYLLNDNTFLCTYMMFKTHGYLCHHFYHIMTLTPTARFHIGLVNQRWYKEALQGTDISDNEFVVISLNTLASKNHTLLTQFLRPSNSDVNQIGEFGTSADNYEISKVISKKRKFGKLFGLGKKIMKRSQIIVGDNSSGDYNNGNLPEIQSNNGIIKIQNPIVRKSKGRPKSKRVKGILEESNNTKTQYKCKNCKQIGHNSKICKGKENQGVGC